MTNETIKLLSRAREGYLMGGISWKGAGSFGQPASEHEIPRLCMMEAKATLHCGVNQLGLGMRNSQPDAPFAIVFPKLQGTECSCRYGDASCESL